MALSIKKQSQRARERKDRAVDAIYACAPNSNTRFNDCFKLAPAGIQSEYEAAASALLDIEALAVSSGKAWRASIGMLIWD